MKKRLLSMVLAVVMLLSLLPVHALAATEDEPGSIVLDDPPAEAPDGDDENEAPEAAIPVTLSVDDLAATDDEIAATPLGNLVRPLPGEGVTVTATASTEEVASVAASGAIDGLFNANYRWGSAVGNGPHWLQIDLGAQRAVSVIKIYWERDNVIQYNIQGSQDGTNWEELYAQTARTEGQTTHRIELDTPVKVRYLKITTTQHQAAASAKYDGTTPATWNAVSIMEVEAFRNAASIPVSPADVVNAVTLSVRDGKVVLDTTAADELAGDWEFEYSFAANLEQVVGEDGTIYTPLVNTQVELDVTAVRKFDDVSASTPADAPITLTIPGAHVTNVGNTKPKVIPEIMEWYSSSSQKGKNYTLTASSKIVAPAELAAVASEVKADIQDLFGFDLTIATSGAAAGDIVLVLDESKADEGFDNETYLMAVTDRVTITGSDATGVYWGTRSALQALKLSGDKHTIPQGTARDYPEFRLRGFVMDVGRRPVSMDMLYNIVKNMSWYKLNDFHVHLNDNLIFMEDYGVNANNYTNPAIYAQANNAYSAFRLESSVQEEPGANPLTAKDYAYTKEQFKTFITDSAALGVNIVPEFDAPAHAKSIADAFPSLRLQNVWGGQWGYAHPANCHLDLTDKYAESLSKVQEIFDDYLDESDPVFTGSTIHLGADEYFGGGTPYRKFMRDMIAYAKEKGRTPRIWGSLSHGMIASTDPTLQFDDVELNRGVQLDIWNTGWANPTAMYNLGFDLINVTDGPFYMVPSGSGGRGGYGDYLNLNDLYAKSPNQIGNTWFPASSSQILGEAFAMWNDNIDTRASGLDEVDLFDRFFDSLPVAAVRMWGEGDRLDRTLDALQTDISVIGTAPQTDPYCAKDGGEVSFDFSTGDGLTLTNATVENNALTLNGGASYAETGMDRLGWGSTLTFNITVNQTGVIFEDDCAYGEYAIKALPVAGKADKWKLGFSRELYDYEFDVELPMNEAVELTITTAKQSTKLTYNGAQYSAVGKFVSNENSNTQFTGKTGINHSSFEIPVARIGSRTDSFAGQLGEMTAESPEIETPELPDEGTELVNLALRRPVTVSGSDSQIGGSSVNDPALAVDGDVREFEEYAWIGADMTTNRVDGQQNPPQWLVVDLGEDVAEMNLKPEMINIAYGRRSWATKYDIQTADSPDGPWTSLLTETVSRDHAWGYIPGEYPNRWVGAACGDSITGTAGGGTALKEDAVLKRYVRLYVTEVNAANGSATNISGNNAQCKSVAVTEFQVFARLPYAESAENIRAYKIADNQAQMIWDDAGTTSYQVYAKAPGGEWTCVSGDDVVEGNTFTHTGYVDGTVYRVLTPASDVNGAIGSVEAVDIRETGENGYVLNTVTDRIAYSEGWSTWAEEGSYIGPSVTYCNNPTESLTAEFIFVGNGIQVIGGKKNTAGQMTVEIDGVAAGTADYRNSSAATVHKQVVFEKTGLEYGVHTIKLTAVANSGVLEIEAFRVLVPATSVTLSATGLTDGALTLATGAPANVIATVAPTNGWGVFAWTSDNAGIAAADDDADTSPDTSPAQNRMVATINPKAGGTATITVKDTSNPEVKAEVVITVTQPVTNVILPAGQNNTTLYLNPGAGQSETFQLTPTVMPASATNKNVTYSSNAESVATVSDTGLITAHAAGRATITVTSQADPTKSATCVVTVKSNPTAITVEDDGTEVTEAAPLVLYTNRSSDLTGDMRNKAVLTAVLTPAGAETGLTWNRADDINGLIDVESDSDDPTKCTITVTGISETNVGEETIRVVSTSNSAITATFKVRVLRRLVHDVTISVAQEQAPRPGVVVEANINRLGLDDAGKEGLTYQWYRGDNPIDGATDETYTLADADIGADISVKVTAVPTDTYFYEGERTSTNTVTVGRNAAPAAPALSATDADNVTKGSITITDFVDGTASEISSDGGNTWEDATVGAGGVIGELDAGDYQVRLKATDTHDAGLPGTITVKDTSKTYHEATCTITADPVPETGVAGVATLNKTSVEDGTSVTLTVKPSAGYEIASVMVGDEELDGTENADGAMVYTVENVTAPVAFAVAFEQIQVTITHNLTNGLNCSLAADGQVADGHTVPYGTREVITLVAEEGYNLPDSVQITGTDGEEFTGYTYSQNTGAITITGGVTEDITITAAGTVKRYQVAYTGMTGVSGSAAEGARIATHGQDYTTRLTAQAGYQLPETITVKRGAATLIAGTDYTYNSETGDVTIFAAAVTGNLSISATGETSKIGLVSVSIEGIAQVGQQLTAVVNPAEAANYVNYQWIRVDENGDMLTAVDIDGETGMSQVISAESLGMSIMVQVTAVADGPYAGTVTSLPTGVVIAAAAAPTPVAFVTLDQTSASLKVDEFIQLTPAIRPADATNQTVTWESDNEAVATVDNAGVVTAVGVGTAVITVTTVDGNQTATCTVTVTRDTSVDPGDETGGNLPTLPPLSNTTATTTTNPDGSTTTTVTDTVTGAVTATTEKPDGTVEVVETKKDGTVTTTVTDPEGGKVEKVTTPDEGVTITVTNADGEELARVEIPAEIPALDADKTFIDVREGYFAEEAINNMAALGVVNGKGDRIFDPKSPMKRSELSKVLYELANGKEGYTTDFIDVPATKWYADSVAWAVKAGVVKGVSDTEFEPERTITREELAAMLCRYARMLGMDTTAQTSELDVFSDGATTHAWAASDMAWCVQNGILQGKGNGVLDPRSEATRAEVAVMLQRFVNLIAK